MTLFFCRSIRAQDTVRVLNDRLRRGPRPCEPAPGLVRSTYRRLLSDRKLAINRDDNTNGNDDTMYNR